MINGIINIYKAPGYTSFDVVAKMRGILKQKKMGHTGTLDPEAVGVLPVCLGSATKLVDQMTEKTKEYIALCKLGVTTDTLDMTGEVLSQKEVCCSEEDIRKATKQFLGEISQLPPMYSAVKVNGQKLCDLARSGKTVERKPRQVYIHEIEILSIEIPYVKMRITCSKGTYIRSLCNDLGDALGCGGAMEALERTKSGIFTKENAVTLEELEAYRDAGRLSEIVIPVDAFYEDYPKACVIQEADKFLYNGNPMILSDFVFEKEEERGAKHIRVYDSQWNFYGVYELCKDRYKPEKMFIPEEECK